MAKQLRRSEFLVQSANSSIVHQKQMHSTGGCVISSFVGKMQVSGCSEPLNFQMNMK
jgi:hypothetical protein